MIQKGKFGSSFQFSINRINEVACSLLDTKKEILTIPKPVRMLGEGHTMLGSGLTYYVSEGILNLKETVLVRYDKINVKNN